MRRSEDFHHSPEQVSHAIAQAIVLLDEHELTELERAHALPTLLTLLSSKQVFYEQMGALPNLALPGNARH